MQEVKSILGHVDRVVGDIVVVIISNAEDLDNITFSEIHVPLSKFSEKPAEGSGVPINPETLDLIIIHQGNTLYCEVSYFISGINNEVRKVVFEEPCKLSGLMNHYPDGDTLLKARRKMWQHCKQEKKVLEKIYPNQDIFIKNSIYWTDLYQNRKIFTVLMRRLGYDSSCESEVPNTF